MNNMRDPLTDDHLRATAPSIFATEPYHTTSDKFIFTSTIHVIDALREHGFYPVWAAQTHTRIAGKGAFTRHMVRLRSSLITGAPGLVPEILMVNAHDGTAKHSISLGLLRAVCGNGLCTWDSVMEAISVRHIGVLQTTESILEASMEVVKRAPIAIGVCTQMNHHLLNPRQQTEFAKEAITHSSSVIEVEPRVLLRARRHADKPDIYGDRSLWLTYNTVQENLIKGGLAGKGSDGRRRHTRGVSSITEDLKINKALWNLAVLWLNK